ncbi:MAG: phosphoribosylglycinamide formyltransferase [Verrucomicrobiota bacterium]
MKLGILGSGRGSNFVAIAEAISAKKIHAEIVLVASDHPNAYILTEAKKRDLPTFVCLPSQFKTKLEPEIEAQLAEKLLQAGAEWVVLAGYMRVVKKPLLEKFPCRIVNIHPSLLPAFPGLRAWEQALKAGVKETGCTVHWVDEGVDTGPIIAQTKVPVCVGDTPETLHQRIQKAEHQLFPEVLSQLATSS